MSLSPQQKKYLLMKQFLIPIVLNAVINGGIAWLVFGKMTDVPMQNGVASIVGDTLLTCFLLPAITCLAVTSGVRKLIHNGQLSPLDKLPIWKRFLDRPLLFRAIIFGAIGLSLGAAALFMLTKLGIHSAPAMQMIIVKMIYTGIFAGIACPIIAILAMSESVLSETRTIDIPAETPNSTSSA